MYLDINTLNKKTDVKISKSRNLQLDGLRAIAFLSVFFHHSLHIPLLWCGVDLFFVLSGFLITGILIRDASPYSLFISFYWKRFIRIFPPYYLTLFVTFYFFSSDWHKYWYWYTFFISNFQQAFGFIGNNSLNPTWSLAVEEQFYLLWPLLIYLLGRSGIEKFSIILILLAPLFRALSGIYFDNQWGTYMLLPCRIDLLASGALLAILLSKSKDYFFYFANKALLISVVSGVFFLVLVLSDSTFRAGSNSLLFNTL